MALHNADVDDRLSVQVTGGSRKAPYELVTPAGHCYRDAKIAGTPGRAIVRTRAEGPHAHPRRNRSAEEGDERCTRRGARVAQRRRPDEGAAQPLQAQFLDAKSEVSAAHQKDMFFNEVEVEGAQPRPQPPRPRTRRSMSRRTNAPNAGASRWIPHCLATCGATNYQNERVRPHDGAALREIGVEVSEQLDVVPNQVRVIRHERVKYACPCFYGGPSTGSQATACDPHYVTAQWAKLVRYVDDGRYPIDNNACENAIRPFVVGRRKGLFAVTVAGANASANLY
jgi:hypothetical protein